MHAGCDGSASTAARRRSSTSTSTADAVHENIAAVDLAGGLARQQPELAADVLWGARALVDVEARWAGRLVDAWQAGGTALRASPEDIRTAAATPTVAG